MHLFLPQPRLPQPPPRSLLRSIEALTVSADEVNIAVITFAADAHVERAFNATFDQAAFDALLTGPPSWIWDNFPYTGHFDTDGNLDWRCIQDPANCPLGICYHGNKLYCKGTNFAAAVDLANEVVNGAKHGARANVTKLVVMLADGNLPTKTSFYESIGCNPNNLPDSHTWRYEPYDASIESGRACYVDHLRTAAGALPTTYAIGVNGEGANAKDLSTLGALAGSKVLDADSYEILATETSQIVSDIIQSQLYYCSTTSTTATSTTITVSATSTTSTYTGSTSTDTTTTSMTATTVTTTTPNITIVDLLESDKNAGEEMFLLLLLLLIPCCGAAGYFMKQHLGGSASLARFEEGGFTLPTFVDPSEMLSSEIAPTMVNGPAATAAPGWNSTTEQLLSFGTSVNPRAPTSGSNSPPHKIVNAGSRDPPMHNEARTESFSSLTTPAGAPISSGGHLFGDGPVMLNPLPSNIVPGAAGYGANVGNVSSGVATEVSQEEVARLHSAAKGFSSSSDENAAGYVMASATPVSTAEMADNNSFVPGGGLLDPSSSSGTNIYAAQQRMNSFSAEYDPELQLESAGFGETKYADEYQTIMPDHAEFESMSAEQKSLMFAAMAANDRFQAGSVIRRATSSRSSVHQAMRESNGLGDRSYASSMYIPADTAVFQARRATNSSRGSPTNRRSSSQRVGSAGLDPVYHAQREANPTGGGSARRSSSTEGSTSEVFKEGSSNPFAEEESYSEPTSPTMLAGPSIVAAEQRMNGSSLGGEGGGMFEDAVTLLKAEAVQRVQGTKRMPRRGSSGGTPIMLAEIGRQNTEWARPLSMLDAESSDLYLATKGNNSSRLNTRRRSISYEGALNLLSKMGAPAFQADGDVFARGSREPVSLAKIGRQDTNWNLPGTIEDREAAETFEARKVAQDHAMLVANWDLMPAEDPLVENDYIELAETPETHETHRSRSPLPRRGQLSSDSLHDTIVPLRDAFQRSLTGSATSRLSSNDTYDSLHPSSRLSSNETYNSVVPSRSASTSERARMASSTSRLSANDTYEGVILSASAPSLPSRTRRRTGSNRPSFDSSAPRMSSNETYEGWTPPLSGSARNLASRSKSTSRRNSGGSARY